ncbi:hypothetical protein LJC64_00605 [Ruminococcaceae bacterium OttesenSCG-928-A11]|nr:hypothetical protein [Ruminococcaceae bacterium OttesenSCG-928-A11]
MTTPGQAYGADGFFARKGAAQGAAELLKGRMHSMPTSQAHDEFVSFMVDYTAFLARMRTDENDKLAALSSRDLSRIERSISVSQANAMQLDNFEARRQALQAAAGYEGLSFRELIAKAPGEDQDRLWQLFTRFEGNVAEIRFFNDKSMAVARDNMIEIDPESVLPSGKGNNPYERIREKQGGQGSILETKV